MDINLYNIKTILQITITMVSNDMIESIKCGILNEDRFFLCKSKSSLRGKYVESVIELVERLACQLVFSRRDIK